MFYATQLDKDTRILIEADATGAFTKSDLEDRPDPETAVQNAIKTVGKVGAALAQQVGAQFEGTGCAFEVTFSVKVDSYGAVMVATSPEAGQIKCAVIYGQ